MLYWVTGAINSSFWPYYARLHRPWPIPDGAAHRGADGLRRVPAGDPATAPRAGPSASTTSAAGPAMPAGGHFAALEEPEALAADIRAFFRDLR